VRAYFLTLQYWLAGSDDNVANLVRSLVNRYADGPRKGLRGTLKVGRRPSIPRSASIIPACRGASARSVERIRSAGAGQMRGTVGCW
jgi:magnesium chelatase subunit H